MATFQALAARRYMAMYGHKIPPKLTDKCVCGHPARSHFGVDGTCISGHRGEASVCPCLRFRHV